MEPIAKLKGPEHSPPATMYSCCSIAVNICEAEKSYGNKSMVKPTFTGLNLTLPRGNIYALLGPSGCGKTTLLRCILGRQKLDKGSISVFGHLPGSRESGIPGPTVGYMAQENTVYLTMNIHEYLWYYGTILGVSSEKIRSRMKYYLNLLKLPSENPVNNTLSGGQLRRLQFVAALIHNPKLLILDEPTVGIDVITKLSMWQHLLKLTKDHGTTILLTTHYIEEARLADRVGMIHNRTMAAEDSTANLLMKYNETTLEDVFLKICYDSCVAVVVDGCELSISKDGGLSQQVHFEENGNEISAMESVKKDKSQQASSMRTFDFNIAWCRLYPIVVRSFIGLYRFPGALVLLLLMPGMQVALFRATMDSPVGGISMIVVNEDVGQIGAQYLSHLSPAVIIQVPYKDYNAGIQAVYDGEAYGMLHVKPNFSSVFHKRYSDAVTEDRDFVDAAIIELKIDNSNANIAKFTEFHLLERFQTFLYDTLRSEGINPLVGQLPINVSQEAIAILTRPPSVYVLSGLVVFVVYFNAFAPAIFNIFMEKEKGYMEPNRIAGVTPLEMILGILLFQVILLTIQVSVVVLIILPALIEFNQGSIFLIWSLLYIQGFGGTALGIVISLAFDQPTVAFGVHFSNMFLSAGFAGMFWPIEAMPLYFRYFCRALPLAFPSRAVEVIIHRGWDLHYSTVYNAFAISFLWIFIFLALSFWLFSRKK